MATDYAFDVLRLHRMELNIRPENTSSRAVAEKVGYREEGFREKIFAYQRRLARSRDLRPVRGDVPGGEWLDCVTVRCAIQHRRKVSTTP